MDSQNNFYVGKCLKSLSNTVIIIIIFIIITEIQVLHSDCLMPTHLSIGCLADGHKMSVRMYLLLPLHLVRIVHIQYGFWSSLR